MVTKFDDYKHRKFKPGDLVVHKLWTKEPIKIIEWKAIIVQYTGQYLSNKQYTFLSSRDYRLMTDDEFEEWEIRNNANKYNL